MFDYGIINRDRRTQIHIIYVNIMSCIAFKQKLPIIIVQIKKKHVVSGVK